MWLRPGIPALSLSLALVSVVARAQPQPQAGAAGPVTQTGQSPPSGSRVVEAQQHITAAMGFFRSSDYTRALHEFELANVAAPSPELWYNIARAHELLHEYDDAAENYRRYLRDKVDPPDRTEVEAHIRDLESLAAQQALARRRQASGATIHVEVPLAGARIYVDDQLRGTAPSAATWSVTPGVHGVRVEADGRQSWRADVRVRPGEPALVLADPAVMTRYRTLPRSHLASGIILGLAGAALVAGTVFGVQVLTTDCTRCADLDDRATRADVSFGITGGLVVAAAIVYFLERGASRTETVRE